MNSINPLFPIGFRFQPTDEELVNYFLLRKINSGSMNQDGKIQDIDIYNHEPIELYRMYIYISSFVCISIYIIFQSDASI